MDRLEDHPSYCSKWEKSRGERGSHYQLLSYPGTLNNHFLRMFDETTVSQVKVWNHPTETTKLRE